MKKSILLLIILVVACGGGGESGLQSLYLKAPDYTITGEPSIFGDSLAWGLANQYKDAANYGVCGSTTSWWKANMPPPELVMKTAVVWLATNDLNSRTVDEILVDYWFILVNLKAEKAYCLPLTIDTDKARDVNEGIKGICAERYIDISDIPVTTTDGLHPDAVMNELVIARIKERIGE